jgi:hypothetical protein
VKQSIRIACVLSVIAALAGPMQTRANIAAGAGSLQDQRDQFASPRPLAQPAAPAAADIYLIDDDLSNQGCADYLGTYTRTLTALGLSYVLWEAGGAGSPPIGSYSIPFQNIEPGQIAVYFAGNSRCGRALSFNAAALHAFLNGGGRMVVFGRDVMYFDNLYNTAPVAGSGPITPEVYFGATFVADSAAVTGVVGVPALSFAAGLTVDLAGAGLSVDEIALATNTRADMGMLLKGAYGSQPVVGTRAAAEPTIERVKNPAGWDALPYRTELATFGLESVGSADQRAWLLDRLVAYLREDVTVSLSSTPTSTLRGNPVTLNARASVGITRTQTGFNNAVRQYRWDFGDASPVVTTAGSAVTHTYASPGSYVARVEVVDTFGHKAVQSTAVQAYDDYSIPIEPGVQVSFTLPPGSIPPGTGAVTLTVGVTSGLPTSPTLMMVGGILNIELRSQTGQIVTLTNPATLVITYTVAALGDVAEWSLRLYRWQEPSGPWIPLRSTVDVLNHLIVVQLDHFSRYAMMAAPLRVVFMPVLRH